MTTPRSGKGRRTEKMWEKEENGRAFNGGSRLPRSSIVAEWRSGSVDDLLRCRERDHEEHQEEHEEQPGEKLRDRKRRAGNTSEAEQRREKADDEKHQCHLQH